MKPLHLRRQDILSKLPTFWPSLFENAPESVAEHVHPSDLAILASLKSLYVDRFEIKSETSGQPQSLRFTFEFGKNVYFEDEKLVKDFRYRDYNDGGLCGMISEPVPIKWKSKKVDPTKGLLDEAHALYGSEKACRVKKGKSVIDLVEREGLWQYEKLRSKMEELDNDPDFVSPSFFNWFGYRGIQPPVAPVGVKKTNGETESGIEHQTGKVDDEEEEDDDDAGGLLDVEIAPEGEQLAIALAEDMWPNIINYYCESAFR